MSVISATVLTASPVLVVMVITAPPTVSFKELFTFSATSDTLVRDLLVNSVKLLAVLPVVSLKKIWHFQNLLKLPYIKLFLKKNVR
ncbi:hypothetical protein [Nostoc sp. FACHB-133]|uniref:hypothetical protein n=1 Tax=Nostoc sp. FACHB-133 TaxID=2692835 RepID=UPI0016833728|nr:hypothetical protein [Nostoc sp. FACHB-133]MBD2521237.1 hypothetical protein [Nostoc sp. FACHB-133]